MICALSLRGRCLIVAGSLRTVVPAARTRVVETGAYRASPLAGGGGDVSAMARSELREIEETILRLNEPAKTAPSDAASGAIQAH